MCWLCYVVAYNIPVGLDINMTLSAQIIISKVVHAVSHFYVQTGITIDVFDLLSSSLGERYLIHSVMVLCIQHKVSSGTWI